MKKIVSNITKNVRILTIKRGSAPLLIVLIAILFLITPMISAQEITTPSDYNWWNNILHNLQKTGLFTAEGQSRQCSINADKTINVVSGQSISKATLLGYCGGKPSLLVNVFDTSWHFINEYRVEIIGDGMNAGANQIWEVYCCPYPPCSSNSGCSSPPASNYGNTCNTIYGSCYLTVPTHTTKVYQCTSGTWVYWKTVSYGASTWCVTEGYNNYMNSPTTGGCYASAPSGWCTIQPIETCSDGIKNQDETGIDCGGSCSACIGNTCNSQGGTCKISCDSLEDNIGNYNCFNILGVGFTCCKPSSIIPGSVNYIPLSSIKKDKISSLSTKILVDSICLEENCPYGSCTSISNFLNNELSTLKSEVLRQDFCDVYKGKSGIFPVDRFGDNSFTRTCLFEIMGGNQEYFENSFGLCIVEEAPSTSLDFLKFLAFMDVTGDGKKDGVDGLLIGIALLFLLIIIFKR